MASLLASSLGRTGESLRKGWYSTGLTFVLKTERWSELVSPAGDLQPIPFRLSVPDRLTAKVHLVLAAAHRGSPPEMSNAELRIDARTVDEPGSDSRWNCNGYAASFV